MKKVLLGLLAISAVAMAADASKEDSVDIETKAFIVNSGLIITDSEAGTLSMNGPVNLDHGTLMVEQSGDSEVSKTVYIRRTNGNLPAGTTIDVELKGTGILTSTSTSSTIPHTLTATVDSGTADYVSGDKVPTLNGNTNNTVKGQFEATGNVKIDLTSVIDRGAYTSETTEGAYTNTSTLNVRYSRDGGLVTEGSGAGR